jgi:sulfur carrier protein ThiS
MDLLINGERHQFPETALGLEELLTRLPLEQPRFAGVILNGGPVDVNHRGGVLLRDGDRLEIMPYLGGG